MAENTRVMIDSLPEDKLREDNYRVETGPVPTVGDGEVLCRSLAVSVTAGSRAGLQGSASYAGAPTTGIVMGATAVARVEESKTSDFNEGDLVVCGAGWQVYSVHKGESLSPVDPEVDDPAHYLGALGTNGLTAYFGLVNVGEVKPGDQVLVSAAAGSVGHLVGQMAAIRGAEAIGVAGSDTKCSLLVDQLGFAGAANYRDPNFWSQLKETCQRGVDLYFDNTGGTVLDAALRRMNTGGRIVCCGVVSQYDTSNPGPGPRGIPGLLVNKRIRMEGFLVFDFLQQYDEARTQIRAWMRTGELKALQDEYVGLEQAPRAFVDLLSGGNVGTRIVRVPE